MLKNKDEDDNEDNEDDNDKYEDAQEELSAEELSPDMHAAAQTIHKAVTTLTTQADCVPEETIVQEPTKSPVVCRHPSVSGDDGVAP